VDDSYVETHDHMGQTGHVALVMLDDERARGQPCIPLTTDTDRAHLSGRAARRSRLEARDWVVAIGGLLLVVGQLVIIFLQVMQDPR